MITRSSVFLSLGLALMVLAATWLGFQSDTLSAAATDRPSCA
jgi:hypothetical protein